MWSSPVANRGFGAAIWVDNGGRRRGRRSSVRVSRLVGGLVDGPRQSKEKAGLVVRLR
jgi:hypothetical protein